MPKLVHIRVSIDLPEDEWRQKHALEQAWGDFAASLSLADIAYRYEITPDPGRRPWWRGLWEARE